jgi:hypothetical protein
MAFWDAGLVKQNIDKIVLRDAIQWWDDVLFAMRRMEVDAPNPVDKDLMQKIIARLNNRKNQMQMALEKLG